MTQDKEKLKIKIKDYSGMSENKTPSIKTQNLDKALIKENLTVRAFIRNGEKWEIYEQRSQFNTVERAVVQTHSKEHQPGDGERVPEPDSGVESSSSLSSLVLKSYCTSLCVRLLISKPGLSSFC